MGIQRAGLIGQRLTARKWLIRFMLLALMGCGEALLPALLCFLEYRRLGRPLSQSRKQYENTEFYFDDYNDVTFRAFMRGDKASLNKIYAHLDLPATLRTVSGERFRSETGFLVLWRRMSCTQTIA